MSSSSSAAADGTGCGHRLHASIERPALVADDLGHDRPDILDGELGGGFRGFLQDEIAADEHAGEMRPKGVDADRGIARAKIDSEPSDVIADTAASSRPAA